MANPDDEVLQSSLGAVWIQPKGANMPVFWMGCVDLGDISEPLGGFDLIQVFNRQGKYKTVGKKRKMPEKITFSVDQLSFKARSWIEKHKCPVNFYFLQRTCGDADIWGNWVRMLAIADAERVSRTDKSIVVSKEGAESAYSGAYEAPPAVGRNATLKTGRVATGETENLNSIRFCDSACSSCGCTQAEGCEHGFITADAGAGVKANVLFSDDGITWAAGSNDPGAVNEDNVASVCFKVTRDITRKIVARRAAAGTQGKIYYTDDDGATTGASVNIGGAAAGHGATMAGGLFALDFQNVWLASAEGYIYKSIDGGVTWSAKHSGTLTTENLNAIWTNETGKWVVAVGDNDVVLVSEDGGDTWTLETTGTGAHLYTVTLAGCYWWTGGQDTSAGGLYYSTDAETWLPRALPIGADVVKGIRFANTLKGFLIYNDETPFGSATNSNGKLLQTLNGGYTWEAIRSDSNAGYNDLFVCDENTAWIVGNTSVATGLIVKVYEEE